MPSLRGLLDAGQQPGVHSWNMKTAMVIDTDYKRELRVVKLWSQIATVLSSAAVIISVMVLFYPNQRFNHDLILRRDMGGDAFSHGPQIRTRRSVSEELDTDQTEQHAIFDAIFDAISNNAEENVTNTLDQASDLKSNKTIDPLYDDTTETKAAVLEKRAPMGRFSDFNDDLVVPVMPLQRNFTLKALDSLDPTNLNVYPSRHAGTGHHHRLAKQPLQKEDLSKSTKDGTVSLDDILTDRCCQQQRAKSTAAATAAAQSQSKPPVAAHYFGYTGHYIPGIHLNYKGNGRIQHLGERYVDWKMADWMDKIGAERYFNMIDGELVVFESGVYLIYAQIHYVDVQDVQAFRVYRNGAEILQCTTMTHTNHTVTKSNTCYTSALEYLNERDRLSIGDVSHGVHAIFQSGRSFFGLVRIAAVPGDGGAEFH